MARDGHQPAKWLPPPPEEPTRMPLKMVVAMVQEEAATKGREAIRAVRMNQEVEGNSKKFVVWVSSVSVS